MLAGVEGTSSYGAGLTRVLEAAGIEVAEVSRQDRAVRRRKGKSDPLDAYAAARAALAVTWNKACGDSVRTLPLKDRAYCSQNDCHVVDAGPIVHIGVVKLYPFLRGYVRSSGDLP